jgi:predicted transcriptional regulator
LKINKITLKNKIKEGESQARIAKFFNCSRAAVSKAVKNLQWEETNALLHNIITEKRNNNILNDRVELIEKANHSIGELCESVHELNKLIWNAKRIKDLRTKCKLLLRLLPPKGNILFKIAKLIKTHEYIYDLSYLTKVIMKAVDQLPAESHEHFRNAIETINRFEKENVFRHYKNVWIDYPKR